MTLDQLVDKVLRQDRLPGAHGEQDKPANDNGYSGNLKPVEGFLD